MFYVKYLVLLQIINAKLQLNLYFTDDALKNNDENTSIVQQQHCLYAGTNQPFELLDRLKSHFSLVAYCLSEPLSEFNIDNIDFFTNFTFVELRKMNITSEDLYLWSASIDLIENYQYYLNKNDSVLSTNIFYNCTWPRFGPQCQYELDNHNHDFPSLKEYINTYHHYNDWSHTNWTCYIHLECIRSPGMRCLDWTDICDGKVDCLNNGIDEQHCWQLEINVCQNDEYRCYDGLCVPKYFLRTENVYSSRNCLHTSSYNEFYGPYKAICMQDPNHFECHDSACLITYLSSSCFYESIDLIKLLYFPTPTNVFNVCWSTFLCLFRISRNCSSNDFNELLLTVQQTCPNMMFIPSIPILFGDIYITYIKDQSRSISNNTTIDFYLCSNNSQYENYFINNLKIRMRNTTCYEKIQWTFNRQAFTISRLFKHIYGPLHSYNRFWNYSSNICKQSHMYQCFQSDKCISIYRVLDDTPDCPYSDDENVNLLEDIDIQNQYKYTHFQCPNSNKFIPHWKLENGNCDCDTSAKSLDDQGDCEIYNQNYFWSVENVYSNIFCNGVIDFPPVLINGKNITDETDCKPKVTNKNVKTYLQSSSDLKYSLINTLKHCHFGVSLHVWLDSMKQLSKKTCLCPSNYYGDQCQYQNQRVILRIAFDTSYNRFNTAFLVSISLIDNSNERMIHSHEQFTETRTDYCRFENSLNLFYSTRPKDERKSYFIHVDIYERISFKYRASYLFPIDFPFLPVNLVSKVILIPKNTIKIKYCSNRQCNYHGKCIFYWNDRTDLTFFCQCDRGWSGRFCTIEYQCTCSSDSLCIGLSAQNRSICVCPMNRLGVRCLINDRKCSTHPNETCQNGGQCLANNDISIQRPFLCLCSKGFHGDLCEKSDYHISFSFDKDVDIPSSIYIYGFAFKITFIQGNPRDNLGRAMIYKRISRQRNLVRLSLRDSYQLIFIEDILNKQFYLIQNVSQNLMTIVTSSDRCLNLMETVNLTELNSYYPRRLHYYTFLCKLNLLNLSCFLDDIYLCMCLSDNDTKDRQAICMRFSKELVNNCSDDSHCRFHGQCFHYDLQSSYYHDGPGCLKSTWCKCNRCYYGTQCEFTTSGFGLSIDSILGYHIETQTKLIHQPLIVQISLVLTIVYFIFGSINSLLSFLTFKNHRTHEVGCGFYLLTSSIITFLLTIFFVAKMLILIFTQMNSIDNELFLSSQCYSLDFVLRCCLYMDRWLSTFVAIERTLCTIQGVNFNKARSKRIAKFVISCLLIFIMCTNIHNSMYKKLIDDENEMDEEHIKRIWCISDYSSVPILSIYNNIIHTFHFCVPFMCDLIAPIVLIMQRARHQANAQHNRTFQRHLREQFHVHKHLLFAPIVLVILALPNLVITYVSKCMESIDDAWIYLIAYFISFTPPILTFIIFVLPSKFYKDIFKKVVKRHRKNMQRCLRLTL